MMNINENYVKKIFTLPDPIRNTLKLKKKKN